jgi:preprotein translocase subunit SecG
MESLVLVVHVLAAIAIIALVLLQQGKGADAGAAFGGGGSQTVFGSQGNSSFFGRLTALFAVIFFVTSFGLAFISSEKANSVSTGIDFVPVVTEETQDSVDIPQLDADQAKSGSDLPTVD